MARLRSSVRGALIGIATGSVAALADQLIRASDPTFASSPTAAFAVVIYWAVAMAPLGLVVGLAFGKETRRADAVISGLAFCALVGGYVNQRWLPELLDPVSLVFDAALIGLTALMGVFAVRSAHRFDLRPRVAILIVVGIWAGTALAASRARTDHELLPPGAVVSGPDILVVLLDALRADHCSAYGYERETTPYLDQLAAEGARFDQVYSVSSWTKPVVATLFSGMYPTRHRNHAKNSLLLPEVLTLPEILRDSGYRTSVFAENNFVSPLFGYGQGVEHFEGSDPSVYTQTILGHLVGQVAARVRPLGPVANAARVLDRFDAGHRRFSADGIDLPNRVVDWVERLGPTDQFFSYVHLLKPHAPYRVPEEFEGLWSGPGSEGIVVPPAVSGVGPFATADQLSAGDIQHLIDNYDERIRFGDHQLSQIVEGVRALDRDPIVVVLSDHGEEFGENGLFDHGHSLQEGVVRVPLVVSWPGHIPPASRISGSARLLDLPPSLLVWSGLEVPDSFDGEALDWSGQAGERPVLLELRHGPGFGARSIVRDRLKLVVSEQGGQREDQVFDLEADPGERSSVAVAGEDPLVWLIAELDALVEALEGRGTYSGETTIDRATQERLRALGYVN